MALIRKITKKLNSSNILPNYSIEISSPGLLRKVRNIDEFFRFKGSLVKVIFESEGELKVFKGIINNIIDTKIELKSDNEKSFGSTGSGKTVLSKVVIEEAAVEGIPVIAFDPQGDIASLMLPGDPKQLQSKNGVCLIRRQGIRSILSLRSYQDTRNAKENHLVKQDRLDTGLHYSWLNRRRGKPP